MNTYRNEANILDYLLVTLLLCFSGNPAFVSVSITRELYLMMFAFVFVICFIKRRFDIFYKYTKYIFLYLILFTLQVLVVQASISGILFVLIKTFIGCGVFLLLGTKFSKVYVNVMFFVSVISLCFFLYNQHFGLLLGLPTSDHTFTLFVYTELVEKSGDFISRNSGMFWEPGAFQSYINIAIFFIFSKHTLTLKDYLKAIVLLITVITTYSTSGYIILGLILAYFIWNNKRISVLLKFILIILMLIAFLNLYYSLDFLSDKVSNAVAAEGQVESRLTDHIRLSSLILKHPFIGNSFLDGVFSGNGFVLHVVFVGFIGVLYYWIVLLFRIKNQSTKKMTFVFILIILLSLMGEVFIMYPLYLALPFIVL